MDLILIEKILLSLFAAVVAAIAVSKLCGKKFRHPLAPSLSPSSIPGSRSAMTSTTEVLHTIRGVEFGSRTRNVVFDIFTGKGQDMAFIVYGEHWRKMRRIMTVPFFTNKVVQ
ncbi:hypothetical protein MLD38_012160 [Melastoma candidum]|uniref:Uncharacterized protein n=1 Tax=Melastoma candidum TaxID=119954 RepID=A0ACB9R769_9MYRT|nr:hypothetical protein MLD38_012160 [Melastoma candidum]